MIQGNFKYRQAWERRRLACMALRKLKVENQLCVHRDMQARRLRSRALRVPRKLLFGTRRDRHVRTRSIADATNVVSFRTVEFRFRLRVRELLFDDVRSPAAHTRYRKDW